MGVQNKGICFYVHGISLEIPAKMLHNKTGSIGKKTLSKYSICT